MIRKTIFFLVFMTTLGFSAQAYTKTYYYPARQNKAFIVAKLDELYTAKKDLKWKVEKIKIRSADDYVLNYIMTATKVNIDAEIRYEIHPKFLKMTIEKDRLYDTQKSIDILPDSDDEEYRKLYRLVKRAYVDSIVEYFSEAK